MPLTMDFCVLLKAKASNGQLSAKKCGIFYYKPFRII